MVHYEWTWELGPFLVNDGFFFQQFYFVEGYGHKNSGEEFPFQLGIDSEFYWSIHDHYWFEGFWSFLGIGFQLGCGIVWRYLQLQTFFSTRKPNKVMRDHQWMLWTNKARWYSFLLMAPPDITMNKKKKVLRVLLVDRMRSTSVFSKLTNIIVEWIKIFIYE